MQPKRSGKLRIGFLRSACRVFFPYIPFTNNVFYGTLCRLISQNSSGVEQLTRNEQVKGSIPFFGSDGSFGSRFLFAQIQNIPDKSPGYCCNTYN